MEKLRIKLRPDEQNLYMHLLETSASATYWWSSHQIARSYDSLGHREIISARTSAALPGRRRTSQAPRKPNIAEAPSLCVRALFSFFPSFDLHPSEDTELGASMELEVGHAKTEVYTRVQA
jgi:hypothetical protein